MKTYTRLRQERRQREQTQDEIARLVSMSGDEQVSQYRISQLERGMIPTDDEKRILSEIFQQPPEKLFERVNNGGSN